MAMHKRDSESGAVSLFLVIFAMLLITVVTLSFLRVMVIDQSASITGDLSKSALDSAMAGTEDAKRELIYYRTSCMNTASPAANCGTILSNITSNTCNQSVKDVASVPSDGTEVRVQQTAVSTSSQVDNLNQAYTCVKMQLDTPDYEGSLDANASKLIPLSSGDTTFSSVKLSWYSADDLTAGSKIVSLDSSSVAASVLLHAKSAWPANRPSLMRAQLMQFGNSFTLSDFDNSVGDGAAKKSNADTLFLYPSPAGTPVSLTGFSDEVRKQESTKPWPVTCKSNLNSGGYACSVTLSVPQAIGQNDATRTAYLRLTSLYNASHFTVELMNGADTVNFSKVQPSIDSTGRANDQYRRVQSRVDLIPTDFTYPEAAIDITGDLCKDFSITDKVADYQSTCTP